MLDLDDVDGFGGLKRRLQDFAGLEVFDTCTNEGSALAWIYVLKFNHEPKSLWVADDNTFLDVRSGSHNGPIVLRNRGFVKVWK
jgi:hypothetical protein